MAKRKQLRCTATTRKGKPCKAVLGVEDTPDGLRCPRHDPTRTVKNSGPRKDKGKKRPPPPPVTLSDAVTLSAWITSEVAAGKLDLKRATVMIRALDLFCKAFKERAWDELEPQLKEMRAEIKRLRRKEGKV
jgi:hypothetical protein